jgi:hypothetical protein
MAPHLASILTTAALIIASAHSRTLFVYEEHQLTREFVASLPEDEARLLAFDNQFEDGFETPHSAE